MFKVLKNSQINSKQMRLHRMRRMSDLCKFNMGLMLSLTMISSFVNCCCILSFLPDIPNFEWMHA